jgi:hypothetical protein
MVQGVKGTGSVCQQDGQKALRALAAKKSSILSRIDTASFQSSTKVRSSCASTTSLSGIAASTTA